MCNLSLQGDQVESRRLAPKSLGDAYFADRVSRARIVQRWPRRGSMAKHKRQVAATCSGAAVERLAAPGMVCGAPEMMYIHPNGRMGLAVCKLGCSVRQVSFGPGGCR